MSEIVIKHFISITKDMVFWIKFQKLTKLANTVMLISVICYWMSKIMQENDSPFLIF